MTTKNKAYAAIVSVGLLALVIDRVYFTPPSAAAAPAAIAEAIPHSPSRLDATIPEAAPEGTIASKLAAVGLPDLANLTDAFSPSKAWIGGAQPVVDDFKTTHKLTAVMTSHSGGGAIVNGQLVKLGQTLDGFTLTAINSRTVEFVKGATKVELSVGI